MLLIGIAGGSGAGKTTVVKNILSAYGGLNNQISVILQDSYYKDNSHLPLEERKKLNYDHPDSIEFEFLIEHLDLLKQGKAIEIPTYSYITCTRIDKTITLVPPQACLIVEGILVLAYKKLRDLFDIKVFIDVPEDERLVRIIKRDIKEKERTIDETLERYFKTVKPMHLQFIEPSKYYADIIIPQGGKNSVAIDFLVTVIKSKSE